MSQVEGNGGFGQNPEEKTQSEPPGLSEKDNEVTRLARLAMSGDDSVWGEIYERTNRYVYFLALKSLHSEQDAQDMTQEAYIQAIRSIGQLYDAESFFGWLRSIVFSKCKDLLKKKKPVLLEDESPGLLDSMPEVSDRFLPDMTLDSSESKRMVLELVDALPYQQRQTILFYYYDEMTVDQIAALMECPAGTVKSRLNYARQQIKAGVEEHERKGVKLYGAATLPILTMLLREQAKTLPIPPSLDGSMTPIIKKMSMPESGTAPPGGYADPANPAASSGDPVSNAAPHVPQGYAAPPPAPGVETAGVAGTTASAAGATAATAISTKVIAIIVAASVAIGGAVFALTRGGEDEVPPPTMDIVTEDVESDNDAGYSPREDASNNDATTAPEDIDPPPEPDPAPAPIDIPDYITIREVQYSTSLTELHLNDMNLSNDEIEPLRYMINLRVLNLSNNQISEISSLAGLSNLLWLGLLDNQISELPPLEGLASLMHLYLSRNQISDISLLSGLTSLVDLGLDGNQISDASPLEGLTNLWQLYLSGNQISDISPLAGLTTLERLHLSNNQISDISPLAGLSNLTWLDLMDNQISDISPLAGLANLEWLGLWRNQISNTSPLAGLVNLEYLYLDN